MAGIIAIHFHSKARLGHKQWTSETIIINKLNSKCSAALQI